MVYDKTNDFLIDESHYRRIVAGPGTGKTYTLKEIIRFLFSKNVAPREILLMTFTRMAAKDMQKELALSGIDGVLNIKTGTLHSFCLEILKKSGYLESIDKGDRILFNFEETFLIEDMSINDSFHEKKQNRKNRLHGLEAGWAREQNQIPGWPTDEIDIDFSNRLNRWLNFHEGLLLGEIISLTVKFLQFNPQSPEKFRYKYILVDEYQDLNKAEQHFIDLISEQSKLIIVGDEDQSIYEDLRFARPEGILKFHENHENTADLILEKCFRCPPQLVLLANNLIQKNKNRSNHKLLPEEQNPEGNIEIIQYQDITDEINGVADMIEEKVNSGDFLKKDIIVLTPLKELGYSLKKILNEREIESRTFFSNEFLDGNPKKDSESGILKAITLLQLYINHNDKVALRCWLGYGHNELRKKEYFRLLEYCEINNLDPFDTLERLIRSEISINYIEGIKHQFTNLIQKLDEIDNLEFQDQMDFIFPKAEDWANPIYDLLDENINDLPSLYEKILEVLIRPELPTDVDFIRIMTLYKSKGLTAKHVIIMGFVEGLIPKAKKDFESPYAESRFNEEQRRLFYVALTRAKETLIITNSLYVPLWLANKYGIVKRGNISSDTCITMSSLFLEDLGPQIASLIRRGYRRE